VAMLDLLITGASVVFGVLLAVLMIANVVIITAHFMGRRDFADSFQRKITPYVRPFLLG